MYKSTSTSIMLPLLATDCSYFSRVWHDRADVSEYFDKGAIVGVTRPS